MATTEAQPWDLAVPVEDVADSASAACWAVEEQGWKDLVPDMPDEVIELLAPAVVVTAATLPTVPGHGTGGVRAEERSDEGRRRLKGPKARASEGERLERGLVMPTVPRRLRRSR